MITALVPPHRFHNSGQGFALKFAAVQGWEIAMQKYQMCIDREYVVSASGKWFDSYNPYNGNPFVMR